MSFNASHALYNIIVDCGMRHVHEPHEAAGDETAITTSGNDDSAIRTLHFPHKDNTARLDHAEPGMILFSNCTAVQVRC